MKVAIIGSRTLNVENLGDYLPESITEIVTGGAKGIDFCAEKYAKENGLRLVEFLPEYEKYRRNAPLVRNKLIIEYADEVVAFWDGKSRGTKSVIDTCEKQGKKITVHIL